jgi:hypothetical protein
MDFYDAYKSTILTSETVLDLVDEYTMYCYYTKIAELIPGRCYHAPYRDDRVPSLTLYPSRGGTTEYMWKDMATGEAGNIFKLIRKVEQLDSMEQVLARINEDFGLGYEAANPVRKDKVVLFQRPELEPVKIRIVEQPFTLAANRFWRQFSIEKDLLDLYHTTQVKYLWTWIGQAVPRQVPDPTFAYRVGTYYQIYSPYVQKVDKFRNDMPESHFFGYLQLPAGGNKLIIDKSAKDVIFCRRLGYNAVCGKSETIMIPDHRMMELKDRFKEVYLTLDNDAAGMQQTEKYMSKYPWLKPRFLNEAKDKTDLCIKVGFEQAERTINALLQ